MTSKALGKWGGERAERVDRLFTAHCEIGRDMRDEFAQLIILRLAAEFQGFSRDLHDQCISAYLGALGEVSPFLMEIIDDYNLRYNRRLDSGNASPSGLGADFRRLGVSLWPALLVQYPAEARKWNAALTELNAARNGIAHDDHVKLEEIRVGGCQLTLDTARQWSSALDSLAIAMDTVCEAHLECELGKAPW